MAYVILKAWQKRRTTFKVLYLYKAFGALLLPFSGILLRDANSRAAASLATIAITLSIFLLVLLGFERFINVRYITKIPPSGARLSPAALIRVCLAIYGGQLLLLVAILGAIAGITTKNRIGYIAGIATSCCLLLLYSYGFAITFSFSRALQRHQGLFVERPETYEPSNTAFLQIQPYVPDANQLNKPLARAFGTQRQTPFLPERDAPEYQYYQTWTEHPWLSLRRDEAQLGTTETNQDVYGLDRAVRLRSEPSGGGAARLLDMITLAYHPNWKHPKGVKSLAIWYSMLAVLVLSPITIGGNIAIAAAACTHNSSSDVGRKAAAIIITSLLLSSPTFGLAIFIRKRVSMGYVIFWVVTVKAAFFFFCMAVTIAVSVVAGTTRSSPGHPFVVAVRELGLRPLLICISVLEVAIIA
ncbi:hypothetical protein BGZ57DRAFT_919272, partial [Hyaloscypha finlandica]